MKSIICFRNLKFYNISIFSYITLNNTKKGLIFGAFGVIFVGFQPVVANSRPHILDAYLSAAMTCLVEAMIFLPILLLEAMKKKNYNQSDNKSRFKLLSGWKKNLLLFVLIGLIFSINQVFFFVGYEMAGAINGSLTQKTTVFFGIILGYLILKEKITKLQLIFSCFLFLGLTIGITQFFTLVQFSITILFGVLILLLISFLWMVGHTLTKPVFDRKEATPIQMVFIRNFLSGILLISTYFIIFPVDLTIFRDIENLTFFFIMGGVYGSGLVCWYKTLSYLEISKATIIFAPTPIISAIFASFILGEIFTIFNLIGTIIVIISIIVIVNQKEK